MSGEFEVMQQMQDSENAALRRKTEALEETVRHQSRVIEKHDTLHEHTHRAITALELRENQRMKLVMILLEEMLRLVVCAVGFVILLVIGVAATTESIVMMVVLTALDTGLVLVCIQMTRLAEEVREYSGRDDEE